jgi:predicted transcriptional regulator
MPRIRQNAQIYAEDDFRRALRHSMVDAGMDSQREVADASGIPASTLCKRLNQPGGLTVDEMRQLFAVVRPPVPVLLALLGYPADKRERI